MSRGEAARIDRGVVMALVAMGLSVLILANDFTALNVALPSIEKAFDTDVSTVQWVINAYALVFGMLIVSGGRLADLFGRRRVFFIGTGIFVAMSLLGGAAQDEWWLVIARAAMGVGAAMMWPAILGMTFAALPGRAGLAGGIILGCAGLGQAIGPISGGVLTEFLSWRWTLFVNLPIGGFAVLVTWLKLHQPREQTPRQRLDYGGIVTLSIALLALLFALDQATDWGWGSWKIIVALCLTVVLIGAFLLVEHRMGRDALVPEDVMGNGRFATACIAILLMSATFIASMLYLPQFLQKILHYSAFKAGVAMLPIMVAFAALSFVAGPLYERLGAKLIVPAGTVCIAVGALLLGLLGEDAGYTALLPGMLVLGVGFGLFYSSATTAGITALDEARASLAGGIAYMFQIAGGAVGLGLTTTIFTSASEGKLNTEIARAHIPLTHAQAHAAHGILAGTKSGQNVQHAFPAAAHKIEQIVRDAFVNGFDRGFRVDAALALVGVLVAVAFVGGRLRHRLPFGARLGLGPLWRHHHVPE